MSTWAEVEQAYRAGPQAQSSPMNLARHIDPAYKIRQHLQYLSSRLSAAVRDVENGTSRYLMVSMPPRMGKSQLTSVYLVLWLLIRHPEWPIGMMSHSPSLAISWGRAVRRIIEDKQSLGIQIAHDAGAVSEWQTYQGGGVVSRSVPGQSITGLGFRVMILDDVVKDFAAAHSPVKRAAVWDWWTANSRTRLEPPSLVIAIGTRWHEDDFMGRLLSEEYEGDPTQWEVISFPAISEGEDVLGRQIGEPLISPLLDESNDDAIARWQDIKTAVGSYTWYALYQQHPVPAEGAIFSTDWFNYWKEPLPSFTRTITSWDCAFKGTDGSDYVVGQKWGVIGADRYLIAQVRGRWSFTETIEQMLRFHELENVVEDKANGTAVIDVLKHEISGMIPVNPTESKEARARAVTPQVEAGNVYLPAVAPWIGDFLSEIRAFPTGVHDDQVDAMTQALNRLRNEAGPPHVAEVPVEAQLPGW